MLGLLSFTQLTQLYWLQVTALQIASLKRVNRRTQILLLDKNGTTSKAIARELSRRGFRKIRVIQVKHLPQKCVK